MKLCSMSASLHLLELTGVVHARCRPLRSRVKNLCCRTPRVAKQPNRLVADDFLLALHAFSTHLTAGNLYRREFIRSATERGESSEASFQTQLLSATKYVYICCLVLLTFSFSACCCLCSCVGFSLMIAEVLMLSGECRHLKRTVNYLHRNLGTLTCFKQRC